MFDDRGLQTVSLCVHAEGTKKVRSRYKDDDTVATDQQGTVLGKKTKVANYFLLFIATKF